MMTITSTFAVEASEPDSRALPTAYWLLRVGAALCFIGHGAFGFITKVAWIPYFGVVGIPETWAWRLMPLVGAVDVLAGMAVLYAPRVLPLVYMVVWATWTAMLRPLAGEPIWETLERAGNYGVPLALLVLTGAPRSWRELWRRSATVMRDAATLRRMRRILQWTTALLLVGHGALGALMEKSVLRAHYAWVGLPIGTTQLVGLFEMALAVAIVARPMAAVLIFVTGWKIATESLWIATGTPIWEFVERAGSYAAPLSLALLLVADRDHAARRTTPSAPPVATRSPSTPDIRSHSAR
jgi:hypothetical protein